MTDSTDPVQPPARPQVAIIGAGGGGLSRLLAQRAETPAATEFFQVLDALPDQDRRLATVEEITSISEIPDADNIVVARVRGWDVVVRRDEFIPGDRCVYFEVDSMLDVTDERYAFLEPRGVRTDAQGRTGHVLKTARLRGRYSQGLVIDIAQFPELANAPVGFDATEVLGITKWDPPIPAELLGEVRGMRPTWIAKTGAERIQNRSDLLGSDDPDWYATEKLDGESMTVWATRGGPTVGWSDHGVCTRGVDLDLSRGSAMAAFAQEHNLFDRLDEVLDATGADRVAISGEFIGEGVKGNKLRITGKRFVIFRVTLDGADVPLFIPDPETDGQFTLLELFATIGDMVVPHYPDLRFPATVDEGVAQVEGLMSLVNPSRPAEGIVWRNDRTGEVLKAINNRYLLKNDR
jgi:RNA ligase (TIGR02306 family)